MVRRRDLTNKRFGRLVAIEDVGSTKRGLRLWKCQCDCGNTTTVQSINLNSGNTKSCGCLHSEKAAHRHRTHGMYGTPTYSTWSSMMRRCCSDNNTAYPSYVGRGIRVCSRWMSFEMFYEDMGDRPSENLSIDRIDNDGHYSCGHCEECVANGWTANCRWATRAEQAKNRRNSLIFEIEGVSMCLADWCRHAGVGFGVARRKLLNGCSIKQALGMQEN